MGGFIGVVQDDLFILEYIRIIVPYLVPYGEPLFELINFFYQSCFSFIVSKGYELFFAERVNLLLVYLY